MRTETKTAKKEDGSVNSLGSIPSGKLTRKASTYLVRKKKKLESVGIAGRILSDLHEMGEPFGTKLVIQGDFDANKLPQITQALTDGIGGDCAVAYDSAQNCFYVDATPEIVAKVVDILKQCGVEVTTDAPQTDQKPGLAAPGPDGTGQSDQPNEGDAVPGQEATPDAPPMDTDDEDPQLSDDETLHNTQLKQLLMRVMMKVDRMSPNKKVDAYKTLMLAMMHSAESKSGAARSMFQAMAAFKKNMSL